MNFELTVSGVAELVKKLEATPDQVKAASWRTFNIKGQQAEQRMKLLAQRNFTWRTGALAGSIGYVVENDNDGWPFLSIGAIHDPPPYVAVQEYGKTITGRPWLTIPIEHPRNPMLSQSGGAQTGGAGGVFARDIRDDPGQFGFSGTFVHEGIIFGRLASGVHGTGHRFVGPPKPSLDARGVHSADAASAQKEKLRIRQRAFELAAQQNLVPIAVLKRSVRIPPRPFLNPVFEQMKTEIPRELGAQVAHQINVEGEATQSQE